MIGLLTGWKVVESIMKSWMVYKPYHFKKKFSNAKDVRLRNVQKFEVKLTINSLIFEYLNWKTCLKFSYFAVLLEILTQQSNLRDFWRTLLL